MQPTTEDRRGHAHQVQREPTDQQPTGSGDGLEPEARNAMIDVDMHEDDPHQQGQRPADDGQAAAPEAQDDEDASVDRELDLRAGERG